MSAYQISNLTVVASSRQMVCVKKAAMTALTDIKNKRKKEQRASEGHPYKISFHQQYGRTSSVSTQQSTVTTDRME